MRFNLPALRSRNYRLFFAGQGISLIGTWMTQVSTVWLVYQLTHSALILGIVGFISQIASFVFAPFGGVIVDRTHRRTLLIITQALAMAQSLTLAALTLTGAVNIWLIVALSFWQGLITALDAPARQTFVKDMIERSDDLPSAIALNSSLINGARLVGPAIAGIVIARIGAGYCFLIDGISYIAVIAGLLLMRFNKELPIVKGAMNPLGRIKEGFIYAYEFLPIRSILLLMVMFSLMVMPYSTLMPVFAIKILHGDSNTLGMLMAASGIGALSGGIYMISRRTVVGLGKVIAFAPMVSGTGLIAFSLSQALWLSMLTITLVGFGSIIQIASSNTLIQTIVEDDKRGRVMSIYTMSFLGMVPFGNLWSGFLADSIGAANTFTINGIVCLIGAFLFARQLPALRRIVRPIYREKGIVSIP
ncbi:MAG: Enterobactin exporter EntS [Chroococcopsis gigantea SAG 12.99]|jgi:MFS family permease|nr:MFS transporter [Chlorogloea purpurea SAG 13.99]MDV3001294.1 Enterobactin exporter EntS [Chroococcopsis gigantea SAG 12.99]